MKTLGDYILNHQSKPSKLQRTIWTISAVVTVLFVAAVVWGR
ncbi:hypothetical protein [Alishewanella maricola]|nr:hypothetical protein [Alishewanella maricola]